MKIRLKHLSLAEARALVPNGGLRVLGGDAIEVEAAHVGGVLAAERAARLAWQAPPAVAEPTVQGLIRHLRAGEIADERVSLEDHDGGILVRGPSSAVQALLDRDAAEVAALATARRERRSPAARAQRQERHAARCSGESAPVGDDGDMRCQVCGTWL